jgi:hypothetical protein
MIETITFVAVDTGTIVRAVVGRNSVEAVVAAAKITEIRPGLTLLRS